MAKTVELSLKFGHPTAFRRTVGAGDDRRLLVFQPGEVYPLSAAEAKQLEREISSGLLVDPSSDRRLSGAPIGDPHGKTPPEIESQLAELTAALAERDARVADLEKQLAEYDELIADEDLEDDEGDDE